MALSPKERGRLWRERNPEKSRASSRKYYAKNPEKCRAASALSRKRNPLTEVAGHLKRTYGLTLEQYNALVEAQGGMCAICGGPPNGRVKKLVVDHDHATGKLRKLICDHCNKALGLFEDDPIRMTRAAEYVTKHKGEE